MPPVIFAIATVITYIAATADIYIAYSVAVEIATVLVVAATLAASNFLTGLLTKPKVMTQGQELTLKLDPTQPRQIATGFTASGGSLVYAFTWGQFTDAPNHYLVKVISLSDFPITNVRSIFDGNQYLTFGTGSVAQYFAGASPPTSGYRQGDYWEDQASVPYRWYVNIAATGSAAIWEPTGSQTPAINSQALYSEMTPCDQYLYDDNGTNKPQIHMRIYKGALTGAVADPYLMANSPGGEWDSSHKGTGQAYVVVAYGYAPTTFANGIPNLVFAIDGAPCYDDRFSVANGGTQNITDPTTWTYTGNAAVIASQLLRGFEVSGITICGSQATEQDLDPNYLAAAYNTCDQIVTNPDGSTSQRFQAGMMLSAANTVQQDLSEFVDAFNGAVYDRGGVITLLPGGSRTPVLAFTDEDIMWAEAKSWQPESTLSDLYNAVVGTYVPSSQNFLDTAYPIQKSATYQTADGGERINLEVDYRAINDDNQIQRVTNQILKASRFQGTVAFVAPPWALELEQGDWFTLTSTRWGITSMVFEATAVTITAQMKVAIVGKQVDASSYGWDPATEYLSPGLTVSTLARTPPAIVNPTLTLALANQTDATSGTALPGISYSIALPNYNSITSVAVQMQIVGSGNIVTLPSLTPQTLSGIFAPALPNTNYEFRVNATDGTNFAGWSSWQTQATGTQFNAATITNQGALAVLNTANTAQITSGAVSNITSTYSTFAASVSNASAVNISTLVVVSDGGPLIIQAYTYHVSGAPIGLPAMTIRRGSTVIAVSNADYQGNIVVIDQPAAGTYTYNVYLQCGVVATNNWGCGSFIITELKR